MSDMLLKYQNEVVPKLKEEFHLKNNLSVPSIEKIVFNMGLAEALTKKEILDKAVSHLESIAGQKPTITRAKRSISGFKLRAGDSIGAKVTLRGRRSWHFLEKLISVVIPRMRDFRGVSPQKFDARGNYSLGIEEQIIFPEVEYSKVDKIRGLVITVVIKNSDPKKSQRLLELLGLPFKKKEG